jgi:hypothetical protein
MYTARGIARGLAIVRFAVRLGNLQEGEAERPRNKVTTSLLTSGPFGDSMSAAARPKRWGVSRQAKGQEFDPTRVELFTLLT